MGHDVAHRCATCLCAACLKCQEPKPPSSLFSEAERNITRIAKNPCGLSPQPTSPHRALHPRESWSRRSARLQPASVRLRLTGGGAVYRTRSHEHTVTDLHRSPHTSPVSESPTYG